MAVPSPLLHRLGGFHWWAVHSLQGSMVRACPLGEMSGGVPYPLLHRLGGFHWWRFIPCRVQWFGRVIGGGSIPLQVSMVWACPLGEMSGGVPYPLLHRFGGFHWWAVHSLQGDSVSSVGFYWCVGGVSLLQSLAG